MYKRFLSLCLVFCLVFALIPAIQAEDPLVTVRFFTGHDYDYAQQVVDLVNAEREKAGVPPLTHNKTLCEAAMQRSNEMVFKFDHYRPDGTRFDSILEGKYDGWTTIGENIAAGQETPEAVVKDWMNSEGHRKNILNPDFTQIGVGCAPTMGGTTWVQIFGDSTTNTEIETSTQSGGGIFSVETPVSLLNISPTGPDEMEIKVLGKHHFISIWLEKISF